MIKEFKEFIMRGSVLDLAVGVVIGSAFTAIVTKVVDGLITPLIGVVVSLFTKGKKLDEALGVLDWKTGSGVTFKFGDVISAIITFLITAFVLFLVVKAANHAKNLTARKEDEPEEVPADTTESLLKDIRDLLETQAAATKPATTNSDKDDLDNNSTY
ncbi:large conductance mechanosensitive channel protein MscL [Enterococcus sp. AD013-P3]|uniref:large conductance mechanosensitive channel protein MscL n=1 Tax=Enterococcus sp. AD013-P3 TaxID=3411036 RepID=UPI003B931B80